MNEYTSIEIDGLNFSIDKKYILKNIKLDIRNGEFVGLIGPNGAGKTTLLKCINGINRAEGTIKIKGRPIQELSDKKLAAEVSLMHQSTVINFPFRAIDVVLMGRYPYLKRLQRESKEDYRIAKEKMNYTHTVELETSPITEMSGGERQRVLFAKALAQETDIILLDEPTASLDITYQEQIFKYSGEITDHGNTVVAAIHDLKIAARYCTRLILMSGGEIVADGLPEEVLTTDNLSKVYGVNGLVYRNKITGLLDIYINKQDCKNKSIKIHVLGGGGSAAGVFRQLYEDGYAVTSGVLNHGDSDIASAEVFGIQCLVENPFSEISDKLHERNVTLIKDADTVILCNMPFGNQNIRNLEAAKYAERLVIIEDDRPETRDYTNGRALEIYDELRKNAAAVITSARLHESLY